MGKNVMIPICTLAALAAVTLSCTKRRPSTTDSRTVAETVKTVDAGCRAGGMCAKEPMQADGIVRLSKIEVRPEYLDEYMRYAAEVGEVSLRTEPGVLTMYAMAEKEDPCRITILETYASRAAYDSHIASEHFRRYKQGTLHMVRSLVLSDQTPLNPRNRIDNYIYDKRQ